MGRDTKQKLLDSFIELAKKKPLDKITVKQISDNCGVTSQTFYNHFSDKYDLIIWAYKERVNNLLYEFEEGNLTWRQVIHGFLDGYEVNEGFIRNAILNTKGEDSYIKKSSYFLCEKIEFFVKKRRRVEELPDNIKLLIKFNVGGMMNVIAYWLFNGMRTEKSEMVDLIIDSIPKRLLDYYLDR